MANNIDNEKNESFIEILQNEEMDNSKINQEILFITTECWLAQLGSRKKN